MEEVIPKIEATVRIVKHFKKCYMDHKAKLPYYFDLVKEKQTEKSRALDAENLDGLEISPRTPRKDQIIFWEFPNELVFCRYDKFIARMELVNVSLYNSKLPKLASVSPYKNYYKFPLAEVTLGGIFYTVEFFKGSLIIFCYM